MITRRKRAGRGTVYILAMLLAASAALRLGSGVGRAFAEETAAVSSDAGKAVSAVCAETPLAVANALAARAETIRIQEVALETRLAALALADRAITQRMEALTAVENELSSTLALSEGAAEGDLARLTEMYETMKPKDAAALFETMAPEFAAGFLGRMRPDAAAAVLSGMQAEAAYTISVLLAGRNALVPTE